MRHQRHVTLKVRHTAVRICHLACGNNRVRAGSGSDEIEIAHARRSGPCFVCVQERCIACTIIERSAVARGGLAAMNAKAEGTQSSLVPSLDIRAGHPGWTSRLDIPAETLLAKRLLAETGRVMMLRMLQPEERKKERKKEEEPPRPPASDTPPHVNSTFLLHSSAYDNQ